MAPSRLESIPPELKLEIYSHFDYNDLLPLSHVSTFWRNLVLQDKRWNEWFEMIVNPATGKSARETMASFKLLDVIPKRTIVNLCSPTKLKCALCSMNTSFLFLPLLKRICVDCLEKKEDETLAVVCLSSALTRYDVSEKDVREVVVLHWEETDPERKKTMGIWRAKLVSAHHVKEVAIEKYEGEDKLATHLQYKKERVRKAYDKRLAEFNTAAAERTRLKKRGDKDGAAAVTLKNGKKALQKTRPKLPAILKEVPFAPEFYRWMSVMITNFLVPDATTGRLAPQKLVECKMCNVMANVRWRGLSTAEQKSELKPDFPEPMLTGLIPAHEVEVHYAREGERCWERCHDDWHMGPICEACLNAEALATKAELVATGHWDD
ncbi:hypothetical protein B0H16DRAFT_1554735, partial [Mycena metata]